eukprot:1190143-Prorocentrum_minimum.AAC.1
MPIIIQTGLPGVPCDGGGHIPRWGANRARVEGIFPDREPIARGWRASEGASNGAFDTSHSCSHLRRLASRFNTL